MQGFILTAITAAEKCTLVLDYRHWNVKCWSRAPGHSLCSKKVSRSITMQGFILTAITATEECTLILDSK